MTDRDYHVAMGQNRRTEDITGGLLKKMPLTQSIIDQLQTKNFVEPTLIPRARMNMSRKATIEFMVALHSDVLELFRRLPSRTVLDCKVDESVHRKFLTDQTHLQDQRDAAIEAYGKMRSLLVQIHQAQERFDASIEELKRWQSSTGP